jgi:hypothetical protein
LLLRQIVARQRFAEKLCELCYAGDIQAMRLLLSYTDGLPIARAESEGAEGIQIMVSYVQPNNRSEIAGVTPGTIESDPGSPPVQRRLLRAPLGENGAGDGSVDSPGPVG